MTKLLFCQTNYEFKATFTKEPSITIQCNSTGGKQPESFQITEAKT